MDCIYSEGECRPCKRLGKRSCCISCLSCQNHCPSQWKKLPENSPRFMWGEDRLIRKEEIPVTSDCNNKIQTIKFTLWRNDDGSGYLQVAANPGTLPHQLTKSLEFKNSQDMSGKMKDMSAKVRQYEKGKKLSQQNEEWRFLCLDCHTAFGAQVKEVRLQLDPGAGLSTITILACPNCGNINDLMDLKA